MIEIVLALLFMGLSASIASFFLKKSTVGGLSIKKLLRSLFFYLGGFLYVFAALLNIYLLKLLPYSIVVPLGALTYVWTLLISHRFLGEKINKYKVIGIVTILLGVTLLAAF